MLVVKVKESLSQEILKRNLEADEYVANPLPSFLFHMHSVILWV